MEISFWTIGAEPKLLALPVAIFFSRSKLLTTVTLCHFVRWAFFFVISVGLEELVDKTRGTVYLTLNSLFWCMSSTGNLGRNIKKKKKKMRKLAWIRGPRLSSPRTMHHLYLFSGGQQCYSSSMSMHYFREIYEAVWQWTWGNLT